MKSVLKGGHIDVHYVALLENNERRWNTVTDYIVRRNADRFRKALIVKRRRNSAKLRCASMHEGIDLLGVHPHSNNSANLVQNSSGDLTRFAHQLDLFRSFYPNTINHY